MKRIVAVIAAFLLAMAVIAIAQPAQALSRSTWCSSWRTAGTVPSVGALSERACVQYLSTHQVRSVAEVRVLSVDVLPVPSSAPTDSVLIRNIHSEPGNGLETKFCRYDDATFAQLDEGDSIVLSCFSAYVPQERGTARVRMWATVTSGGVTTGTPLTPYFTHTFA